ncbi:MAG: hypothetical protein P8Y67_01045 [Alphaproteobacteria bacterium]
MGHVYKSFLGLGLAAAAVFSLATVAEAGRCKGHSCKDRSGVYRHIYVESDYGSRRVSVPVRHTRMGDQVKLPGGSWVDCEVTCEYTVRRLSVDFWEDQQNHSTSPNYLKYDLDLDTGRIERRYP